MKKLIIGLVIGMMIGSATVAVAAEGDQVQAMFAKFNLIVNGQAKEIETTPLVYNGTSYLPVREMANLVGYDVTYKADSRTIELRTAISAQAANTAPSEVLEKPPLDPNVWILLSKLSATYGYKIEYGDKLYLTKGEISHSITLPSLNEGETKEGASESGAVKVYHYDSSTYLSVDDLKTLEIID